MASKCSKMVPNWLPNDPKMVPRKFKNESKYDPKMASPKMFPNLYKIFLVAVTTTGQPEKPTPM